MVSASDVKIYSTTNYLGGVVTGTRVSSGSPNAIFTNVPYNELVVGEDYYACVYIKNEHNTETMDNFKWWLSSKSFPQDTELKWAFDPVTQILPFPYLKFDGIDDYVDCGNHATLWSQGLTKFSFSCWIHPTLQASAQIVAHGASPGAHRFNSQLEVAANTITFNIRNAADSAFITATSTALTINEWNHITCVYDNSLGSQNLKIYVDAVVGSTTGNLTETINSNAILTIGGGAFGDLKGFMKDFRWWTTRALSQSEVTSIYDGTGAVAPDYWLPLDEGTGNPKDLITEGVKTGVLTNGTVWSNGTAQTIPDKYTAPSPVTWQSISTKPSTPNIGTLGPNEFIPIWLWLHVPANADQRADDTAIFNFEFDISTGGTGTPGGGDTGGSGGNPPPTTTDYKIAVAGDWGCESETNDVIDLIQDGDYDHVIGVGDNAYESASCWTNRFTPLKSIMESAFGNHEYSESGGINPYKTFFGYSLTYLTYKFKNVQVFIIDTNINCDVGSAQHNFIKNALQASQNDNTIKWRIACFHHPMYGASSGHSYNAADTRQNFHQLFVTNKVNFVVTGHNHNWQRTHQIGYSGSSTPIIVDSSSPYLRSGAGFIHVVSGSGGHDSGSGLYSLGSQPSFQAYQNRTHNGIWEIVASNSGNTLTCSFVNTSGDKFDTFTITA